MFFSFSATLLLIVCSKTDLRAQEHSNPSNHSSFEVGIGVSPIWPISSILTRKGTTSGKTMGSVLPPAFYCGYTLGLSEKWIFTAQLGFKGLQNSTLVFKEEYNPYANMGYQYLDSFFFRMNAFTVEGNFKKFRYGGHEKGLYFSIGTGLTAVSNTILPEFTTIYTEDTNPDNPLVVTTTENRTTWNQKVINGFITGGIGGHVKIHSIAYLDLGIQTRIHFGAGKDAFRNSEYSSDPSVIDKSNYDYATEFRDIVKRMTRINCFRSYYLEAYVKIGFSI